MSKQLETITIKSIMNHTNTVEPFVPRDVTLSSLEQRLDQELQHSMYNIGTHGVIVVNAANTKTATAILNLCDRQGKDCILICDKNIYLSGASDVMKKVQSTLEPHLQKDIGVVGVGRQYIETPAGQDVNQLALSYSGYYRQQALWNLQQQVGFHNYGYATVTSLPAKMKNDAADLVHYLHKQTDLVNPIVMAGNPGGRTVIYMNADTVEGKIMASQYAAAMQPNVQSGINAFYMDSVDNVENFLNDANQAGLQANQIRQERAQIKELLSKRPINTAGVINFVTLGTDVSQATAEKAVNVLSENTLNAMVIQPQGQRYFVAVNPNTEIGARMSELYRDSHGASTYELNSTAFTFSSSKELNDFIRDAHIQAMGLQRGANRATLNMLHHGVTHGELHNDVFTVKLHEGMQLNQSSNTSYAGNLQGMLEGYAPNTIVQTKARGSDGITVFVDAQSEMGKYLAAQYHKNMPQLGFQNNMFYFKSQSEADAFVKAGEQFVQQERNAGINRVDSGTFDRS